jgi:starvation-inducible outer membrane lipoprotein
MKPYSALCFLFLAGCATVPSELRDAGSGGTVAEEPRELAEPVRLETRSGTFLVHPSNAADFQRLLAGEPTQQRYTAGGILMAGD